MFFKTKKNKVEEKNFIKVAALRIHAARIDENFSDLEEKIIKQALLKLGVNSQNIQSTIDEAKLIEGNANQILDFTKEVKNMQEKKKIEIIETMWRIIYSNKKADIYETNLMRRLAGLLYIDSKIMGDIKNRVYKESLK